MRKHTSVDIQRKKNMRRNEVRRANEKLYREELLKKQSEPAAK
jgi:hypothetical protein